MLLQSFAVTCNIICLLDAQVQSLVEEVQNIIGQVREQSHQVREVGDKVRLVLWYRDDLMAPIYSLDSRGMHAQVFK